MTAKYRLKETRDAEGDYFYRVYRRFLGIYLPTLHSFWITDSALNDAPKTRSKSAQREVIAWIAQQKRLQGYKAHKKYVNVN